MGYLRHGLSPLQRLSIPRMTQRYLLPFPLHLLRCLRRCKLRRGFVDHPPEPCFYLPYESRTHVRGLGVNPSSNSCEGYAACTHRSRCVLRRVTSVCITRVCIASQNAMRDIPAAQVRLLTSPSLPLRCTILRVRLVGHRSCCHGCPSIG